MSQAMLQVKTASKHFLGLKAVDEVSLTVRPGEIVSIIGPNGAGKTTLFNLLTGQLAPTSGEVLFEGQPINHLPPHARARLGMGRTFQISKPLIALTALENVMIGAFLRDDFPNAAGNFIFNLHGFLPNARKPKQWKGGGASRLIWNPR